MNDDFHPCIWCGSDPAPGASFLVAAMARRLIVCSECVPAWRKEGSVVAKIDGGLKKYAADKARAVAAARRR